MDRATYYCVHLRRGVWRHARYGKPCHVCAARIEPGDLYLDTGVQRPHTPNAWNTWAVCKHCAYQPIDVPDAVADLDACGVTEYGEAQLNSIKLWLATPKD